MRNHLYVNRFRLQVHFHATKTHFHKNGFELRLVLKQRQKGTRKYPYPIVLPQISTISNTYLDDVQRLIKSNPISLIQCLTLHVEPRFYTYSKFPVVESDHSANRPFSKMAAENSNKSKLKTGTNTKKNTFTLVTLQSFSISGVISAEKM